MKKEDRAWVRMRLSQWGIWCNFDENLPPHARLRTGGGDYVGDDRDNEDTNHAIICIRKYYPGQAALLDMLYVPDSDGWCVSIAQMTKKHLLKIGCKSKSAAYNMREAAEQNVAFFIMGRNTDRGDMEMPSTRLSSP